MTTLYSQRNPSPWMMVLSYVLLMPMLFYASGGEFSFESKLAKTQSGGYENSLTSMQSSDPLQRAVEVVICLSAVVCPVALSYKRVARDFMELPSVLLIIVWVAASTIWSLDPISSARNTAYLLLNTAFALYLSKRYSPQALMEFISFVGTFFLIANFTVCLIFPRYGITPNIAGETWQGICVHKNVCAYMTVFFLSAVLCQRVTSSAKRLLRCMYIVASFLLIILTQSRTGWILAGFVIVFAPLTRLIRRIAKRDVTVIVLLCALPALLIVWVSVNYLPLFFSLIGKNSSMNGRLPIWSAVSTSILKHPVTGYGYRAFWHDGMSGESASIVSKVGWNPKFAHNGLLEIGLELGCVGMLLILWTIVKALRDAKLCFRHNDTASIDWYLCVVFLTIIVNIDEGTLIDSVHLGWTFFVIACAGLSASAQEVRTT